MIRRCLTKTTGHGGRRIASLAKLVPGLFGVVLLVLQALIPLNARAAEGADWVQICGEFGTTLIQINPDTGLPIDPGMANAQCQTCVMCAASGPAFVPTNHFLVSGKFAPLMESFPTTRMSVAHNAAQFWHQTRGPPRGELLTHKRTNRLSMPLAPKNWVLS